LGVTADAAATSTTTTTAVVNTHTSLAVVATPILLYGIFNVYRDRVNPRAFSFTANDTLVRSLACF
jgi:hypothetical protein